MKQHLLNLIAQGKLEEAIEQMLNMASTQNKYFNNEVIGLSARFQHNENEKDRTSFENYKVEYSRIIEAAKRSLDKEFNEQTAPQPKMSEKKKRKCCR
jgi:Tfp pilus assembly protein PilE